MVEKSLCWLLSAPSEERALGLEGGRSFDPKKCNIRVCLSRIALENQAASLPPQKSVESGR